MPKSIYNCLIGCGAAVCVFAFFTVLAKPPMRYVKINDSIIAVEYVTENHDMEIGLGGRETLCENCGMLFVFPTHKERTFWMKDMKFDLDVLWIRGGKILSMQENISYAKQSEETFSSHVSVDKVLELPAGFIARHRITIGQYVEFFDK